MASTRFALDVNDPRLQDQRHTSAQVVVLQEVEHVFRRYFDAGPAMRREAVHTDRGAPILSKRDDGTQFEFVAWELQGVHTRPLRGIAPTGLTARILGQSLVALPVGDLVPASALKAETIPQFKIMRMVDWLGLYGQLGVVLVSRPIV